MNATWLVDTSVISLLAPHRPEATPAFLGWMARQDRNLFISVVTATEIEQGIAKLRRGGATARAAALEKWLEDILVGFGTNVVPIEVGTARTAGRLADLAYAQGRPPDIADVLIAATAKTLAATVLTRNLRHFQPLGIDALDPLDVLPD